MRPLILSAILTSVLAATTAMATPFLSTDGGRTAFTGGTFNLVPGDEVHMGLYEVSTPPLTPSFLEYVTVFLSNGVVRGDNINDQTLGPDLTPPDLHFTTNFPIPGFSFAWSGGGYHAPAIDPVQLLDFDVNLTTLGLRMLMIVGNYTLMDPESGLTSSQPINRAATLNIVEASPTSTPVPEPSSILLFGTGAIGVVLRLRRLHRR